MKKLLLPLTLFFTQSIYSQVTNSVFIDNMYATGWIYLYRNPDSASWFFEKAKKESENSNYFPGMVMYHNYNAALQIALGQNEKALEQYDQAIAIAQKNNLETDVGTTYMKKGILSQLMGDDAHAAESYLSAASLLKTNVDRKKIIGLYKNILSTLNNLQQQNHSLQNVLPALKKDNTGEKEIVSILSQKKTNETSLDFPDQTTLSDITGGNIYVIFGGAKFPIADFYVLNNYSNYRSIRKIPDGMSFRIPDIPREGTILSQANDRGKVYLIKDKMRHLIENPKVLEFFGGWDALCSVPPNTLKQIPDAGDTVTLQNVLTTFNFKQEYEVLIDTLKTTLIENTRLLTEVGKKLKTKNNKLQNRKILLWTFLVGILALLSIAFLLVRNSRQKQKLHQQSLQALKAEQELQRKMELEKERTRIATDMHDDLGAGLSRIKFLSETIGLKKQQQQPIEEDIIKIREYAHEMIDKMGEIVWALNEKNDSLSDLLSYTRSYAVEYLTQNGIQCRVMIPDDFPPILVSGEFRRNIYLVVKEALHNIVKYAQATLVTINIETDKKLIVTIQDNGIGFNQNETRLYSNGIINIKKRIKDIDGTVQIESTEGTSICLTVPLSV
ncbi:MAG TPA: ATP-binding protein [Chitinophagaceae bacterium]|nr:ATP-binding protein [Chitinophagaceae bacterium]